MIFPRKLLKGLAFVLVLLSILNIIYFFYNTAPVELSVRSVRSSISNLANIKIDWEDHDFINYELTRCGPGENGEAYIVTDPEALKRNQKWVSQEGFFVEVSNNMSLTRALPDHRPSV